MNIKSFLAIATIWRCRRKPPPYEQDNTDRMPSVKSAKNTLRFES